MIAVVLACTLIADGATGRVLKQEGVCDQQVTPASTFKIAIALMGFDSGYLTNEHLPLLHHHPGDPDWDDSWKQPRLVYRLGNQGRSDAALCAFDSR